jgi:hypothetical protein
MQASNHKLLAIALATALASPAVWAHAAGGAKAANPTTTAPPTSAGAGTAQSVQAGARPASPTLPTQADPKASDAITDRTARQESRGAPTAQDPAAMPTKDAVPAMDRTDTKTATAATTTIDTTKPATQGSGGAGSLGTTNPGKGNWWAEADADGDGKLSTSEASANAGVNTRFATIDGNQDGFVTQDEYRTFFTQNASQGAENAAAHSMVVTRDTWLKLDGDADSRISLAEAASNAEVSGAFTTIDANKDGFVTQDEYRLYAKNR